MNKLPLVLIFAIVVCSLSLYAQPKDPQHQPPDNAIVLFDGKDLSAWERRAGGESKWVIADGAAEVNGGDIQTKQQFNDFDLHIEFNIPHEPETAKGQARGNSGVYLQGRYEIQVLESHGQEPTRNGNGAIYNVKAPDVNMSKPPGEWQTYQIRFRAARFDKEGNKTENARVTVIHNGTKIHDDVEIPGPTGSGDAEKPGVGGPIRLQDHGHKVRYRNIWIVPMNDKQTDEVTLFDGANTDGWHQAGPGRFELKDGVLTSVGGMGLFWHEREFEDFTLLLEFKVQRPRDNSGVFVRFPNPGDDPWVAVKQGYEIQIQDTARGKHGTGSIYDFQAPSEAPTKPPGQWNQYEITVKDQQYTVKLNGKVINQFTGDRSRRGHIGIQNHDDQSQVSFRNIRVIEHGQ